MASDFSLTPAMSQQIRYARVLCIGLMIFVHADPVDHLLIGLEVHPALQAFYWFLVMELGRASVPLLSVISGVLIVLTLQKEKPLGHLISDKAQRLLVPLLFWNACFVILLASRDLLLAPTSDDLDALLAQWPDRFFALTDTPANFPLAFLRDIFVCSVLAGIAMMAERRWRFAGQALMGMFLIIAIALPAAYPLVLREVILAFYLAGMLIALNLRRLPHLPWVLVVTLLITQMALDLWGQMDGLGIELFKRLAVCLFLWKITEALMTAAHKHHWISHIAEQEKYIYVVFCSHLIITRIYGIGWGQLGLDPTAVYFPLVYLLNLPLAFGFAWACWFTATRLIPLLQPFMLGTPFRKIKRPQDLSDAKHA